MTTSASVANPTVSPAAYCAAADKLKTSVTAVRNVDIANAGLSAVQADVATIQGNLEEFKAAAQASFSTEVTALRNALADLQTALQSANGNVNTSTLAAIGTSIAGVVSAYTSLQNAVSARCG